MPLSRSAAVRPACRRPTFLVASCLAQLVDRRRSAVSHRAAFVTVGGRSAAVGDVSHPHGSMGHEMHRIQPARLKPGVSLDRLEFQRAPDPQSGDDSSDPPGAAHPRSRAHLLGLESPRKEEEARCHRHRSDHAGRRLRVGEPRDPGRAVEGGIVPLPDARFPRAGPPRRKLPDRGRSICDRIVEGDEPRRTQGRGRRSRPRNSSSSAA